jgi:Na+/H+-dicarboxylate symporter
MDTEEGEKSDASMLDTMLGVLLKVCPPNIVEAAATMNVLGVLTFSLFFGVILARLPGETGQPLIQGVEIFNQVVMGMVMAILVSRIHHTHPLSPLRLAHRDPQLYPRAHACAP